MAWPDAVISADPFSLLFAYYAIGCGVYFALEHWGLELSLYFLTQAALTVGYGDVVPHSAAARLFTACYAPLGTCVLYRSALPHGRTVLAGISSLFGASRSSALRPDNAASEVLACARTLPGLLLTIAGGTVVGSWLFGLAYTDAFYFAASSATTQGYGDFAPKEQMHMLLMIPYLFVACGTFAAVVEECYLVARRRVVRTTELSKVVDQLLFQQSSWDSSLSGAHRALAIKADEGGGLSESEFMLAALTGHNLVDVPTLFALRRQFAQLMQSAGAPAVQRLDARAVFAIGVGQQRVIQRPEGVEPGTSQESNESELRANPLALVDLTAADGGFAEWHEHFWRKRLEVERAKAAAEAGESGANDLL